MKKRMVTLFVAAVLVKVVLLLVFFWPEGCLEGRQGYDDISYFQMARTLVDDGVLTYPNHPVLSGQPSVFRTPGYPLFLAAVGVVTGWNVFWMQLLQAVICSLAPVLLFLVLRQLKSPLWPAWILVFDPITNLMAITFMTEGLLVLFLLASFYCFLRAREHAGFVAGALFLWTGSILIKPSVQFFYVVILLMLLIHKVEWKNVVVFALLACLPVFGWMVRNYQVSGNLCVSTQSDNIILAKITTLGHGEKPEILRIIKEYDSRHASDGNLMALITDNKIDFKEETKEFIKSHSFVFMKYHLLGMPRVLLGTGRSHVGTIFYNNERLPGGIYNACMMLWYVALYALVLALFRLACLRDFGWWFSLLFCAYNVALIGVFSYMTGGGLKRAPFIPFLIILIAVELREVMGRRKQRTGADYGNA